MPYGTQRHLMIPTFNQSSDVFTQIFSSVYTRTVYYFLIT